MPLNWNAVRAFVILLAATVPPQHFIADEPRANPYWISFPERRIDKPVATCRFELGENDFTDGDGEAIGDRKFILWQRDVPQPRHWFAEPAFFIVTEYWDYTTPKIRDNVIWKVFEARPNHGTGPYEHWHWDIVYHREHKRAYLVRLACERQQERAKLTVWEVHRELRSKIDDIAFDPKKPLDKQDLPTAVPRTEHEFKIPKARYDKDKVKPTFLSVRTITRRDGLRIYLQRSDSSDPVHFEYDFVSDKWRRIADARD